MSTIRIISAMSAVAVLLSVSCTREVPAEPDDHGLSKKVQISVNGEFGEFGDTKATVKSVFRMEWSGGEQIYVYGTSGGSEIEYLGTLTATVVEGSDNRVADLSGEITQPKADTRLSLVYSPLFTEAPAINDGVIIQSLASQSGGPSDATFVSYATVDYGGETNSTYRTSFRFATSVLRVNMSGLHQNMAMASVSVSGIETGCKLTITDSGVTLAKDESTGTILRKFTSGSTNLSGNIAFYLAIPIISAKDERSINVWGSGLLESFRYSGFATSAVAGGAKMLNTITISPTLDEMARFRYDDKWTVDSISCDGTGRGVGGETVTMTLTKADDANPSFVLEGHAGTDASSLERTTSYDNNTGKYTVVCTLPANYDSLNVTDRALKPAFKDENGVWPISEMTVSGTGEGLAGEVISFVLTPAKGCSAYKLFNGGTETLKADIPEAGKYTVAENAGNPVTYTLAYTIPESDVPDVIKIFDTGFSVGANKRVQFTKGNLQATYHESTDGYTWALAARQYDYIGQTDGNLCIDYQKDDGTYIRNLDGKIVDLFGWTASGKYDDGVRQYGISTKQDDSLYYFNPGYDVVCDWGSLIDTEGIRYFILSAPEWTWLLGPETTENESVSPVPGTNCRISSTVNGVENARYALVKVKDKRGMLIFPDHFLWPSSVTDLPTVFNTYNSDWNNVNYTEDEFAALESAGCCFLPAAMERAGWDRGSEDESATANSTSGYYWSSSPDGPVSGGKTYKVPYHMLFSGEYGVVPARWTLHFHEGHSVRLVYTHPVTYEATQGKTIYPGPGHMGFSDPQNGDDIFD